MGCKKVNGSFECEGQRYCKHRHPDTPGWLGDCGYLDRMPRVKIGPGYRICTNPTAIAEADEATE